MADTPQVDGFAVSPEVQEIQEKALTYTMAYETQVSLSSAAGFFVVRSKHRQIIGDERTVYIPMWYVFRMLGQYLASMVLPGEGQTGPRLHV